MLELKRLSGEALNQFIPELARLRIEVFRDFPISMMVIRITKLAICKPISKRLTA